MAFYDTPGLLYDSGVLYDSLPVPQPQKKRMAKTKLGLSTLTYDELADLLDAVHAAMVANAATFNAPNPTMAALAALSTALRAAIAARIAADAAAATALENLLAAAAAARAGLSQEAAYVDNKAAGNAATITLAGMGVRAPQAAIGAMTKVLDLKTTTSDSAGELDWMCKPVTGAKAYIVQKCSGDPSVEANWSYASTETKSSGTLTSLATGNQWVRVAAKGAAADPGPWSDPAQEVVR
jgi:hypothetical protein